jgi:hypothetical protein
MTPDVGGLDVTGPDAGTPDSSLWHVVMFGGNIGADTTPSADTWTWDGTSWTRRDGDPHPPARFGHAMATNGRTVVLFGGSDGQHSLNDTWVWDGTRWTQKFPAHVPDARQNHAMANFNGRVFLFGGAGNDTWTWDGNDWTKQPPGVGAPSLTHHAMAATTATLITFGELSGATDAGGTWLYVGGWSPLGATAITPRSGHTMSPWGTAIVLFGGMVGVSPVAETWIFSQQRWAKHTSATSPPPRWAHAAANLHGRVVIFGGSQGDTAAMLNDTWTFDGKDWNQVPSAPTDPPARWSHAMASAYP